MFNAIEPVNRIEFLKDTLHDMAEFFKKPSSKQDPDYALMQEAYNEIGDELQQLSEEESYRDEHISDQLTVIHRVDDNINFS